MTDEYTPTTGEIIRYFDAPHYKVDPQREGEDFASYLSRVSIEGMHYRIASESAARRWLTEYDRGFKESVLEQAAREAEAALSRAGEMPDGFGIAAAIRALSASADPE